MHSLRDWYQANENIMGDAANQRFDSNATKVRKHLISSIWNQGRLTWLIFCFQFAARRTVNETDNQTRWDKYLNDCRLDDRLVQIEQWRCELERVLGNADAEINLLARMKDDCDAALSAKAIPESCCAECLGKRKSLLSYNNIYSLESFIILKCLINSKFIVSEIFYK